MGSIQSNNLNFQSVNAERYEALSKVRQDALGKMGTPEYDSPNQKARLQMVISDIDHQQTMIASEFALRGKLNQAYEDTNSKSPKPANPDKDPSVVSALKSLNDFRKANRADYPKQSLTTGCVQCAQKKLDKITPWVGNTSPEVLAKLNKDLGTKVNFGDVSEFEGGQWRKPYIPCSKGIVAGRSGVTVATGFDVGQINKKQLDSLELDAATKSKLEPFLDKNYKKQSCEIANQDLAKMSPATFTQAEVDAIDYAVKKDHLSSAKDKWDTAAGAKGTKFSDLTSNQQTVIFSRTFQQGKGMPESSVAQDFYKSAQQGNWVDAEQNLRNYPVVEDWYKTRVGKEADLLKADFI